MSGTRVTCTDVETGESESAVIENNYLLGVVYLDHIQRYGNGTTVLTIKQRAGDPS